LAIFGSLFSAGRERGCDQTNETGGRRLSRKIALGIDVLTAARARISWTFDIFERIYVSFSGGKDSTVMLHLAMDEARRRGRKVGLLFVDLEAQYKLTIEHVAACFDLYRDLIDPHWIALPLILRNAVSQFQPRWICWEPEARDLWVREPHAYSIQDAGAYSWFSAGMEFEELVPAFGRHFAAGRSTACLVGIRADESLNRFRTLIINKTRLEGRSWTTWCGGPLWNVYPIYDWRTEDLWTYHARTALPHNRLYDRMHQAGLTPSQMRICQPYGDDQRKGLWLYQIIEPETWGRVVARVNGANGGALYSRERGNVTGVARIDRPRGHTWRSFAELLLESMPGHLAEHYRNKIAVFVQWYADRGHPRGIPDDGSTTDRNAPSWARVCKALLRNDYWCKGLSFTQTKSESYERYLRVMKNRRLRWGI
jgi:predicted phosphoadenosine phosphosulfate sulfurtransferase